jgi:hypothetical protein
MRRVAREVLAELIGPVAPTGNGHATGQANGHANGNGTGHANGNGTGHANGNGTGQATGSSEAVPQVPAPPVAAVLRPSTWTGPAVPGEVIGDGTAIPAEGSGSGDPEDENADAAGVERVTLDSDADLQRFVRALAARLENPRERSAIQSGRVRFTLRRAARGTGTPAGQPEPTPAIRVTKGAATERAVRDAAAQGARLVLGRGAVLTPLARDQARALGVPIDKEGRC